MIEPQKITLPLTKNLVWPHNSLIITRNLAPFPFPSQLKCKEKQDVATTIIHALKHCKELKNLKTFYMDQLSNQSREGIYEHFLLDTAQDLDPQQAIVFTENLSFIALINFENHLTLISVNDHPSGDALFTALDAIDTSLEKQMQFAHSKTFGYLTKDISQCGNGLTFRSYLHLPLLIYQNNKLLFETDALVKINGIDSLEKNEAHVISIENNTHLGIEEKTILQTVQRERSKLIEKEKELILSIQNEKPVSLQDKISRDLSLGQGAKSISTHEALSIISHIELGQKLGWIKELNGFSFKDLFFSVRRGHLSSSIDNNESLAIKRAAHLSSTLCGSKFLA